MVLGYNYTDRTATMLARDGTKFTVPFRMIHVDVPARGGVPVTGLFDMRKLIENGELNVWNSADEIEAARKIIREWPDSDVKDKYLEILSHGLTVSRINRKEIYCETMRTLYGPQRGDFLSTGIRMGRLRQVPAFFLREKSVAELIDFLVDHMSGFAMYARESSNTSLQVMRACQISSNFRGMSNQLKENLKGLDDRRVKSAMFVAGYLERFARR